MKEIFNIILFYIIIEIYPGKKLLFKNRRRFINIYFGRDIDHDQRAVSLQFYNELTATGQLYRVINCSINERELGNSLLVKYLTVNRTPSRYLLSRHLDMRLHVFVGWTRARLFTSAAAARTGFIRGRQEEKKEKEIETEAERRNGRADAAKR